MWQCIEHAIKAETGNRFAIQKKRIIAANNTNLAYQVSNYQHNYFVKIKDKSHFNHFESEAYALDQIRSLKQVTCPEVIATGTTLDKSAQAVLLQEQEVLLQRRQLPRCAARGLSAVQQVGEKSADINIIGERNVAAQIGSVMIDAALEFRQVAAIGVQRVRRRAALAAEHFKKQVEEGSIVHGHGSALVVIGG